MGSHRLFRRLGRKHIRLKENPIAGIYKRPHAAKRLEEAKEPFSYSRAFISCYLVNTDQIHEEILGEIGPDVKGYTKIRVSLEFSHSIG